MFNGIDDEVNRVFDVDICVFWNCAPVLNRHFVTNILLILEVDNTI